MDSSVTFVFHAYLATYPANKKTLGFIMRNLKNFKNISTQIAVERAILSVKKKDHIKISDLKKALKDDEDIVGHIRAQKWGWAGHVARMNEDTWACRVTFWFLSHRKRKKRHQPTRWIDDIHRFMGGGRNYQKISIDGSEWMRLPDFASLRTEGAPS